MRGAVILTLALACSTASPAAEMTPGQSAELPPGSGRDLVIQHCAACHGIERVAHAGASQAGWEERINRMTRWGAKIPAQDIQPMAAYLAAALPPRPRRLTIDTSVTTIAVSEVSVHPVQINYRVAGALDPDGRICAHRCVPTTMGSLRSGSGRVHFR